MSTVLEEVKADVGGRQAKITKDWNDTVRRIADGKNPSREFVQQLLLDAGKTIDDMTAAVQEVKDRRAACAILQQANDIAGQLGKLDAEERASNEAFEKLCKDRDDLLASFRLRRKAIVRQDQVRADALAMLRRTAPAELKAEFLAAQRELGKLQTSVIELRRERAKWEGFIEGAKKPDHRKNRTDDIRGGEGKIKIIDRQLEVEKRIPELEKRVSDLERRCLEP